MPNILFRVFGAQVSNATRRPGPGPDHDHDHDHDQTHPAKGRRAKSPRAAERELKSDRWPVVSLPEAIMNGRGEVVRLPRHPRLIVEIFNPAAPEAPVGFDGTGKDRVRNSRPPPKR